MTTLFISPTAALDCSSVTFLCSFTNPTTLTFYCICGTHEQDLPCSFRPTDEDISELGEGLPHIRFLRLGADCCSPTRLHPPSLYRGRVVTWKVSQSG